MGNPLRWFALVGIALLAFTAFLDFTIVNTALPFIKKAFRANVLQLQWITNIFSMVLATTMLAVGRISDLHGRKKVFYTGVAVFAAAALCAGFSPSIYFLVFFRGLQGLGASILFVTSASLIADTFPKEEQGKAIGIFSGITGLGLAIGPVAGGFLVQLLSWKWVFWVNLPLIAIGMILCQFSLKLPPHIKPETKIDPKGVVLLMAGLGSLIYGIIYAARAGWTPVAWMFLLAGIAILILFVYTERKTPHPLMDFSIFKEKLIILGTLSVCSAGVVSYVFMFFDPLYLENVRNLPAMQIGIWIAAIPVAQVAISFGFGPLLKRFGIHYLLLISAASAFLAVFLHYFIGAKTPLPFLILPFAILGINWGISNAGLIAAASQSVPSSKVGGAIGSIMTVWNIVGSIFLAISASIFHTRLKESFLSAFHSMVDFNILFTLLILIASIAVIGSSRKSER